MQISIIVDGGIVFSFVASRLAGESPFDFAQQIPIVSVLAALLSHRPNRISLWKDLALFLQARRQIRLVAHAPVRKNFARLL